MPYHSSFRAVKSAGFTLFCQDYSSFNKDCPPVDVSLPLGEKYPGEDHRTINTPVSDARRTADALVRKYRPGFYRPPVPTRYLWSC